MYAIYALDPREFQYLYVYMYVCMSVCMCMYVDYLRLWPGTPILVCMYVYVYIQKYIYTHLVQVILMFMVNDK